MDRMIDRYRILSELGRGGMGVVYRARDTVLDRVVALKTFPGDRLGDPDSRQRLLKEAQAASALNHPGIVTIHDLVTVDGSDVIVMELVEGETLEERIARGALPLGKALRIAVQLADALARAHGAGIAHRDLKPSNVMLTNEGTVKILDFGLAKLTAPPDKATPTIPMGAGRDEATGDGTLMGTVPYMSPEQTMGKPLDSRTDVFSFGVLFYEMTSGRHPFRHPLLLETVSAIRSGEPVALTTYLPGLPIELERLIVRCLQKEPELRWQSMSDLKSVLEDLEADLGSGRKGAASVTAASLSRPPRARNPWLLAAGIVAAAGLCGVGAFLATRRGRSSSEPLETTRLTYDTGLTYSVSLSADGKLAVYSSDRGGEGNQDLWIQQVGHKNPVRITREGADAWAPSFSPDGSRVAFRSEKDGGGISVVGALGGDVRRLVPRGNTPRFSPDGKWLAYVEEVGWSPGGLRRMFLIPADGGTPRPFAPTHGTYAIPGAFGPVWSPDGRLLLFKGAPIASPEKVDWWVAGAEGGEVVSTGAIRALPVRHVLEAPSAWVGGSLIFLSGTTFEGVNIYRARISPDGAVSGPAEAWTAGPGVAMEASISSNGQFAFSRFTWVTNLWQIDLNPASGRPTGSPRRLTNDGVAKFDPSISRDGDRLAWSTFAGSEGARKNEIHLLDRKTGKEWVPVEVPAGRRSSAFPRISPDGTWLSWLGETDGKPATFVARTSEGPGREVCKGCTVEGFLPEGNRLFARLPDGTLALLPIEGGAPAPLKLSRVGPVLDSDISPDGGWVAMTIGGAGGTVALRVVPLTTSGPPSEGVLVAPPGALLASPRWSRDGRVVYFLSLQDDHLCLWAQPVDWTTKVPTGDPFAVVHAHQNPLRLWGPRNAFSFAVGRDRLVLNAAEIRGDIYLAKTRD